MSALFCYPTELNLCLFIAGVAGEAAAAGAASAGAASARAAAAAAAAGEEAEGYGGQQQHLVLAFSAFVDECCNIKVLAGG